MTGAAEPRARGRKLIGGGILAAVVLAIPLLSSLLRPDDVDPVPVPDRTLTAPPENSLPVIAVDFADPQRGFAIQRGCEPSGPCGHVLLVTDDGMNWSVRKAPAGFHPHDMPPWIVALGECRVAIEQSGDLALNRAGQRRWFSDDCGLTWDPVDMRISGRIAAIPEGGVLQAQCRIAGAMIGECQAHLVVTMPDSGERKLLTSTPDLADMTVSAEYPMPDGRWWIQGIDARTERFAVAVSSDDGRFWTTTVLPFPPDDATDLLYVAANARSVYAVVTGDLPGGKRGLLAVFHSADHGKAWHRTWRAAEPGVEVHGRPVATRRGLLLIGRAGSPPHHLVSVDQGNTFERAELRVPSSWPAWTRGGYVASSEDDDGLTRWFRSPNGLAWGELAFSTSS